MPKSFDHRIVAALARIHGTSPARDSFFRFGAVIGLYLLILVSGLSFFFADASYEILGLVVRALLALATSAFIGVIIRRHRPEIVHTSFTPLIRLFSFEYWKSFPSDHAVLATIITIATLPFANDLGALLLLGLWLYVLISRVYVGVHYMSDVIGGAMVGLIVQLVLGTIGA